MILFLLQAMDGYTDYETYQAQVRKLATRDTVVASSLAKTLGGREVFLLTVGTGKVHEKPAILVMGSVHAPQLAGSELATRLVAKLAESKLLERFTFYVIPRPNPDASEAFFRKPYFERTGNDRKSDDDRDGREGEDPPDDLNGDGWITMMRIEDDTGGYVVNPDDPRVLIAADAKKNQRGKYRYYVEGKDDDGDGDFNEDGGGVSFNRNFTFQYPYFKPGAGPNAVSEVETRAVADFAFDHPNIAAVFTFTPEDNLLHPWQPDGNSDRAGIKWAIHSDDATYHAFLAERYREIHGGKDAPAVGAEGSFATWAYFHFGRWSFAARAWWPAAKDESIPWTEVKHPDFPDRKVEVGGIKPFATLNPPAKELDPLAEKHFAFLGKLAELLPAIRLEVKSEDLGGGVKRVTATVINDGYLPTMSEMGRLSGEHHPLQVRIDGKLVTGFPRVQLERIAGQGGKVSHSWLVTSAKSVTVWSPSAGSATKEVP